MGSYNREFPKKKVVEELGRLGFRITKGNGTSHDIFTDGSTRVQAKICKHMVTMGSLNSLANELEVKRIIARREFIRRVKGR